MSAEKTLEAVQRLQEDEYSFPYHHVVEDEPRRFALARTHATGHEYAGYIGLVLDKLKAAPFDSLLDIGCGDGKFLFQAAGHFPNAVLEGIDYSENAIRFARAFSPGLKFHVGDITAPGVLGRRYDVVTLIEVLEHILPRESGAFVAGIHRLLMPHGRLVLTVPSDNRPVGKKHYRHFSVETLREALHPHFAMREVQFVNRTGLLQKWLRELLINKVFILNHRKALLALYRYYRRHLLLAQPHNGKRILAVCARMEEGIATG